MARKIGKISQSNTGSYISGILGNPTSGDFSNGLLPFIPETLTADAAQDINFVLSKLAPTKPVNLSTKTISIKNSYSALKSNTGLLHDVVIDNLKPESNIVLSFFDGDSGVLESYIDDILSGSKVISKTPINNSGTYESLVITDNSDPWAGTSGKEGFWRQLSAYIKPISDLLYDIEHSMYLKHSISGQTNKVTFWTDDPITPSIDNISFNIQESIKYISGVPSLNANTQISCNFILSDAIRKHYNKNQIARISSGNTNSNIIAPERVYNENEQISLNKNVLTNNNTYSENIQIIFNGYNSKGESCNIQQNTGARIDTVSNEQRVLSGDGELPTVFGGVYDSTKSLRTEYTNELQLLNGKYQIPTGNYSANLPTPGPDYSNGMGLNVRYVTFNIGSILNKSSLTLSFQNTEGTWTGINNITNDITIQIKINGVTGWLNANSAYPGVGNPINNNDPCCVIANSSYTSKKITFGSQVLSGDVFVRIGLPYNSNKKFSGLVLN